MRKAAAPDLPAQTVVVLEEAHAHAALGGGSRSGQTTGAGPHHGEIKDFSHSVDTCMPGRHRIWHVR